jgi:hypothetical protein
VTPRFVLPEVGQVASPTTPILKEGTPIGHSTRIGEVPSTGKQEMKDSASPATTPRRDQSFMPVSRDNQTQVSRSLSFDDTSPKKQSNQQNPAKVDTQTQVSRTLSFDDMSEHNMSQNQSPLRELPFPRQEIPQTIFSTPPRTQNPDFPPVRRIASDGNPKPLTMRFNNELQELIQEIRNQQQARAVPQAPVLPPTPPPTVPNPPPQNIPDSEQHQEQNVQQKKRQRKPKSDPPADFEPRRSSRQTKKPDRYGF